MKHIFGIWIQDVAITCAAVSHFFSHLNEDFRTNMSFSDNSKVSVVGKSDVHIRAKYYFRTPHDVVFPNF